MAAVPVPEEERVQWRCGEAYLRLLECKHCSEPFQAVTFMCKNEHLTCGGCYDGAKSKCPICKVFEDYYASIRIQCKAGCKEELHYAEWRAHEAACPYAASSAMQRLSL